jgi:chromosome segregation ATPase
LRKSYRCYGYKMYPCDVCKNTYNTYESFNGHSCQVKFYSEKQALKKGSDPNRPLLSQSDISLQKPSSVGSRTGKIGKKEIISNYERYIEELKEYHASEIRNTTTSLLDAKSTINLLKEDNIQLKTKLTKLISTNAVKQDSSRQLEEQIAELHQKLQLQSSKSSTQLSELSSYKNQLQSSETALNKMRDQVSSLQSEIASKSENLDKTQNQLYRLQKEFTERHRTVIDKYDKKLENDKTTHKSELKTLEGELNQKKLTIKKLEEENKNLKVVMNQKLTCSQVDRDVIQTRLQEVQNEYSFKLSDAEERYNRLEKGSYAIIEKLKAKNVTLEQQLSSEKQSRSDCEAKLNEIESSHAKQLSTANRATASNKERYDEQVRKLSSEHSVTVSKLENRIKTLEKSLNGYDILKRSNNDLNQKFQQIMKQRDSQKERIDVLMKDKITAEQEYKQLTEQHLVQKEAMEKLKTILREKASDHTFLKDQLDNLHLDYNRICEDNKVIPTLRNEIKIMCTELQSKKKELYENGKKTESHHKEIDALRQSNSELTAQNNYLKKKVATIAPHEESINALKSEINQAQLIITRKEEMIHQLKLTNSTTNEERNNTTKEILTMQAENKTLRFKITSLEQDRQGHLKQIMELQSDVKRLQSDCNKFSEQVKFKSLELTNIHENLTSYRQKADTNRTIIAELRSKLSQCETQLNNSRVTLRGEQTRYDEMKKKHEQLMDEHSNHKKENRVKENFLTRSNHQLKSMLDELTQKYMSEKGQFEKQQTELNDLNNELSSHKDDVISLRRTNTKLTVELTTLNSQKEHYTNMINNKKNEVIAINKKLKELLEEVKRLQIIKDKAHGLKSSLLEARQTSEQLESLQKKHMLVCQEKESVVGECSRITSELQSCHKIISKNKDIIKTMEQTLSTHNTTISNMNQQMNKQNHVITELQKQCTSQTHSIKYKDEQIKSITSKHDILQSANEKLLRTVENLTYHRNQLHQTTREHQETIDNLNETVMTLRTKNESLNNTISDLESQLTNYTNQENTIRKHEATIRGLRDEVHERHELLKKVSTLEDTVKRNRVSFAESSTKLSERLNTTRSDLCQKVKTVEEQSKTIAQLQKDYNNILREFNKKSEEYSEIIVKYNRLRDRAKSDRETIEQLGKSNDDRRNMIETYDNDSRLLKETITSLSNVNKGLKDQIAELEQQVQHYVELDIPENQIDALRETVANLHHKNGDLKAKLTLLMEKLKVSEQKVARIEVLEREIAEHEEQYKIMKQAHMAAQHQLSSIPTREQLTSFTGKIEVLTSDNLTLRKQLEHYNEQAVKLNDLNAEATKLRRENVNLTSSLSELQVRFNQVLDDIAIIKKQHRQEVFALENKAILSKNYQTEFDSLTLKLKQDRTQVIPTLKERIGKLKKSSLETIRKHDEIIAGYKKQLKNVSQIQSQLESEKSLNVRNNKIISDLNDEIQRLTSKITVLSKELNTIRLNASTTEETIRNELASLQKHSAGVEEQLAQITTYCEKNHAPLESKLNERQLRITELEKLLVTAVTKC